MSDIATYNKKFSGELTGRSVGYIWYDMDHIENTASNSSSIVACVFIAAGKCLPSHCLDTAFFSGSTILAY
jgi:hypothetical protein